MDNKNNNKIDELIAQYFAEGLNEEELVSLNGWLNESEANKKHFNQLQEIWASVQNTDNQAFFDKEKAYNYFKSRVNAAGTAQPKNKVSIFTKMQRIAAVALLFILCGGAGYWISSNVQNKQYANMSVEAPFGSKVKLFLPDGTLVWLNAGSSIEYSQGFGIKDRKLKLNGEAYFEVVRNEKKTFEVTANNLTVSVLGTKFNFRDYMDEDAACVTLLKGKVNVKNGKNGEELSLNPDQQVAYNKKTVTAEVINVKAKRASEWTNGVIFFDEEELPDIARELERLYNVQISIKNEALNNYRFYGSFYRTDQTIQEVMDILASTKKLKYTIEDKTIVLY